MPAKEVGQEGGLQPRVDAVVLGAEGVVSPVVGAGLGEARSGVVEGDNPALGGGVAAVGAALGDGALAGDGGDALQEGLVGGVHFGIVANQGSTIGAESDSPLPGMQCLYGLRGQRLESTIDPVAPE